MRKEKEELLEVIDGLNREEIAKLLSMARATPILQTLQMPRDVAVAWGRFQIWTVAHQMIAQIISKVSIRGLIVIGSANKSGDWRNPFPVDIRKEMAQLATSGIKNIEIVTANDLTHENDLSDDWAYFVLGEINKAVGKIPSIMIYGDERGRDVWFENVPIPGMWQLKIPKSDMVTDVNGRIVEISATIARKAMVFDDQRTWQNCTPEQIHQMYPKLRKMLLEVPDYKKVYELMLKSGRDKWDEIYDEYAKTMDQPPK